MKEYPDKISTPTTESVKMFSSIEGDMQITDSNAAFFDAANSYKGYIVGLHEVLQRQGLMEGLWTLNEDDFWLQTRISGCP